MTSAIMDSKEVKLHWTTLAAEWESCEAKLLLEMVVDLWVTMRGFSYASAWLEKYKDASKKTLQKSKGLRKKLWMNGGDIYIIL